MVERNLAKVDVVGSNPIIRSPAKTVHLRMSCFFNAKNFTLETNEGSAIIVNKMIKRLLTMAAHMFCVSALAAEIAVPEGFCYFGELPQPTKREGNSTPGRYAAPIYTHGAKADLVVLAHGRLWYYINESKPGKILFSEPIELKSPEGNAIEAAHLYGEDNNKLCLRLATTQAVTAQIAGKDVPTLQILAPRAPEVCRSSSRYALADFDGDGITDMVIGGDQATTLHSARGKKRQ